MKTGIIEYLKDPHLVVRFQNFFGVQSVLDLKSKKSSSATNFSHGRPSNRQDNKPRGKGDILVQGNHDFIIEKDNNQLRENNVQSSQSRFGKNEEGHRLRERSVNETNGSVPSEPQFEEIISSESDAEASPYIIKQQFWYYFFLFGTYLGDEVFYATFLPFWFWNIDGAVGRRIVMVWAIVMYLGQGLKDIVCWPRPSSPPVFRLQKKWSLEHGMPSTHAMVGIAIPFSVVIYTMNRYQYPVGLGIFIAMSWCAVISLSRIYLGMHSVLDVVVGLVLAVLLMVPVVPLVDVLDGVILTSQWSPFLLIASTIPMIVFYPTTTHWTPTRGDTTTIISFCVGTYIGAWTNYHLGVMTAPSQPPPYAIIWPSWPMFGTGTLRTVIGLCSVVATVAVCKSAQHAIMRCFLRTDSPVGQEKRTHSTAQNTVELSCKFLTYILLGFNILYLMPNVFKMLRIERPTFYTEM